MTVNVLKAFKSVANQLKLCLHKTNFRQIRRLTYSRSKIIEENTLSRLSVSQTSFKKTFFTTDSESVLDNVTYEKVCSQTLDALNDYFEELVENASHLESPDVSYGDGVLTVKLGPEYGTYVINRQSPNKQIWLSSPSSGPKRYDFVGPKAAERGKWIYKHTGVSLHELLQSEIKNIVKNNDIDFLQLPYSKD